MFRWIIAGLVAGCSLQPALADSEFQAFKSEFEHLLVAEDIPGAALALVGPEGTIGEMCFGYADLASGEKVTSETAFTMGSTSKMMIGVSLAQAIARNEISLDQSIADLVDFEIGTPNGQDLSFYALARHRAGIHDYPSAYFSTLTYHQNEDHPTPLDIYLADYLSPGGAHYDQRDNFVRPGGYHYSNIGAALAAYALSQAVEAPFDKLSQDRIFTPLGMRNTHWHLRDYPTGGLARPYYDVPLVGFEPNEHYALASWPDGGLRSSISDFSTFIAMMINEGRFKDATLLPATDFQALYADLMDNDEKGYGLFVEKFRFKGPLPERATFWGHTGSDPGAVTFAVYNRDWKRGVVLLLNREPDDDMINPILASTFHLFGLEDSLKSNGNCE